MTLMDVRKLAAKQRLRISFRMGNGRTCIVNESGTAQVPGLEDVPDFNIEEELASSAEFVLDPARSAGKVESEGESRTLTRAQLLEMMGSTGADTHADHEEE